MKFICLAFFCCFVFSRALSQENKEFNFDTTSFNQHIKLAEWLYEYDEIAGLTSDSLKPYGKEKLLWLGVTGFCYRDVSGEWQAVYGRFAKKHFEIIFHYAIDTAFRLRAVKSTSDTIQIKHYARALQNTAGLLQRVKDSANIHFSQYIRRLADHRIEVWILPSFQPSGQAIYGCEWKFQFDSTGEHLINSSSYVSALKGVWVGQLRELWLNYRDIESPSPGGVFFAWYFKDYFKRIHIDTHKRTSTLSKDASGRYCWDQRVKSSEAIH